MELKDVVLLVVAVYGAGLSTFNFLHARSRDKRTVKVKLSTAMATYPNGTLGNPFACLEAVNVGQRPVTVTSLRIGLPAEKNMFPTSYNSFPEPDTTLPVTLGDGERARVYFAYSDLAVGLERGRIAGKIALVPTAEDSSGKVHRGTPWHTSAAELAAVR